MEFIRNLEHWGLAARGLHGPKGLGRPGDTEPLPDWRPSDDEMEWLVGELRHRHQGELRKEVLVRYYVHGKGDAAAAISMRVKTEDFKLFRMETERLLFDDWRKKKPR